MVHHTIPSHLTKILGGQCRMKILEFFLHEPDKPIDKQSLLEEIPMPRTMVERELTQLIQRRQIAWKIESKKRIYALKKDEPIVCALMNYYKILAQEST